MVYAGNILYDKTLLESDKKFIIFGAGICGRKILMYLEWNGVKDNVICFCDSYIKSKKDIAGIPVLSVIDVCEQYPNLDYLIGGKYEREMYDILRKRGISKIHLLML